MAIPLRTSMAQSIIALKEVYGNEPVEFAGGIRLNSSEPVLPKIKY